jgi:uncharacterized protein (TIGR01777 family)
VGIREVATMAREIVVTGANGWIGGYVGRALEDRGWSVTGVSRTPVEARARRPEWSWIGAGPELEDAVMRAGAVLNLAGRHAFEQPWTPEYVELMRSSRVELTRRIVLALGASSGPDRLLVSASGYPVYGDAGERVLAEDAPVRRDLVLGAVDADWEEAAAGIEGSGVRVALLRLGLTLGADGGAFPVLRGPFDSGAGVILGSGRQWVPWIHVDDAVRLISGVVVDAGYRGPVNVVAPEPARHTELAAAMGQALGVPAETVLGDEQVTELLGGAGELLLRSQRMVPAKALAAGFAFHHPSIDGAVKDLVARS